MCCLQLQSGRVSREQPAQLCPEPGGPAGPGFPAKHLPAMVTCRQGLLNRARRYRVGCWVASLTRRFVGCAGRAALVALAADCPKIVANKIMDLCGVSVCHDSCTMV
jgi:hypothetical protein